MLRDLYDWGDEPQDASPRGERYDSPYWDALAEDAEKEHGLPAGLLRDIKNRGERSHPGMVSPAGARTPFQIIPSTRDAFLRKYGVDAYADDRSAARVAALHLRESLDRGQDIAGAAAEYHAGPDRARHGPLTRAYVERVVGVRPEPGRPRQLPPVTEPEAEDPSDPNPFEALFTTGGHVFRPAPAPAPAEPAKDETFQPITSLARGLRTGVEGVKSLAAANVAWARSSDVREQLKALEGFDSIERGGDARAVARTMAQFRALDDYQRADPQRRQQLRQGMIGRLANSREAQQLALDAWNQYRENMQATRGRVVEATDIGSVRDFGDWFAFNFGQGVPYLGAVMAAAMLNPALGAAASVGMAAGDIAGGRIEAAQERLRPGEDLRAAAGRELAEAGGAIALGAIPYAALDLLGPAGRAIRGPLRQVVASGQNLTRSAVAGRVAREFGYNSVEEAINEGGQEFVLSVVDKARDGEDLFTLENARNWLNAAAAGAAVGGPIGAAQQAVGDLGQRRLNEALQDEIHAQRVDVAAPAPAEPAPTEPVLRPAAPAERPAADAGELEPDFFTAPPTPRIDPAAAVGDITDVEQILGGRAPGIDELPEPPGGARVYRTRSAAEVQAGRAGGVVRPVMGGFVIEGDRDAQAVREDERQVRAGRDELRPSPVEGRGDLQQAAPVQPEPAEVVEPQAPARQVAIDRIGGRERFDVAIAEERARHPDLPDPAAQVERDVLDGWYDGWNPITPEVPEQPAPVDPQAAAAAQADMRSALTALGALMGTPAAVPARTFMTRIAARKAIRDEGGTEGLTHEVARDGERFAIRAIQPKQPRQPRVRQPRREKARRRMSRGILVAGGINARVMADIIGESNRWRGNQLMPGLFRKDRGMMEDDLVEWAAEHGWITRQDAEDGPRAFEQVASMLRQELNLGESATPMAEDHEDRIAQHIARQRDDTLVYAETLGIANPEAMTEDALFTAIAEAEDAQRQAQLEQVNADMRVLAEKHAALVGPFEIDPDMAQAFYEQVDLVAEAATVDEAAVERAAIQLDDDTDFMRVIQEIIDGTVLRQDFARRWAEAQARAREGARPEARPRGVAGEPVGARGDQEGFLEVVTPEALAQREERVAQTRAQEQRLTEEAERQDRQRREKKEVDEAIKKSVEDFELGQRPEDALAGQRDLFRAPPAAPPAAPPVATLEEARATADLKNALADLADLAADITGVRKKIAPEQEAKLLPILTRLFDAAFRLGHVKFKQAARYVLDQIRAALGNEMADAITIDHLQGAYIGMAGRRPGVDSKKDVVAVESKEELIHVPGEPEDLERDRRREPAARADQLRADAGRRRGREGQVAGQARRAGSAEGSGPVDGPSLFGDEGAAYGERSNLAVHPEEQSALPSDLPAGIDESQRSLDLGDPRVQPGPRTDEDAEVAPAGRREVADDVARAQEAANRLPVERDRMANKASIDETLPILSEGQREDVLFAERRFAAKDGFGVLFTNGTGTGKTFVGLGAMKRAIRRGARNILIAVPSSPIGNGWVEAGKRFGIDIRWLDDTRSAGTTGVPAVTTWANFRENAELVKRDWDLLIADEAHYLSSAASGEPTEALRQWRALTFHPLGEMSRARMLMGRDKLDEWTSLRLQRDELAVQRKEIPSSIAERIAALDREARQKRDQAKAQIAAYDRQAGVRSLFLSATPFSYEQSIDWGEGYLFSYPKELPGRGYNVPDARGAFMVQHFGWRMRTGKLTQPDPSVNRSLMQRQFNGYLRKQGSLSTRVLDTDFDYDRRFVMIESRIGKLIDDAIKWIDEQHRAAVTAKDYQRAEAVNLLRKHIDGSFDFLGQRYLLEAIKAEDAIPYIKSHLDLGRKVVVFHDYKKGGGFHPFRIELPDKPPDTAEGRAFFDFYTEFAKAHQALVDEPLHRRTSPITALSAAFGPSAGVFNGDVPKKKRIELLNAFNNPEGKITVLVMQTDAGKEGVSAHDTAGGKPRVIANLGMPTRPVVAIQQEGRIYRHGQASNAMMRYFSTGTNWERRAFAETIANRAETVENLALGEGGRALRDAFVNAYLEADAWPAGYDGEGTGGRDADRNAALLISEFERAKTFYFGQLKKTARTKAAEGIDYFPTPEPVALKMVEWASIHGGEHVLEPSAGHGAIARWFPETAARTAIEPSRELVSRLALVFDGRVVQENFEHHHIVNKYDAIVANPPWGIGGKTAIDHLAKAFDHLRTGGRIVALLPRGPMADKRFEKLLYEGVERPSLLHVDFRLGEIHVGDSFRATEGILAGRTARITAFDDRVGSLKVRDTTGDGRLDGIYNVSLDAVPSITPGARTAAVVKFDDIRMIADITLPAVTFERAGTAATGRIVVLQRGENQPPMKVIDLSGAATINELFDRIEGIELPARPLPAEQPVAVAMRIPDPVGLLGTSESKHIHTGQTVFTAYLTRKVSDEVFGQMNKAAKRLGGGFSRYRNNATGARPGFNFGSDNKRSAFIAATQEQARQARWPLFDGDVDQRLPLLQQLAANFADRFRALDVGFAVVRSDDAMPPGHEGAKAVLVQQVDGKWLVALNASRIGTAAEAVRSLMHEVVGHFGMRATFGDRTFDDIARLARGVLRARDPRVREAAKAAAKHYKETGTIDAVLPSAGFSHPDYATIEAVRIDYPDVTDAIAVEEVVARMAESGQRATVFQQIAARIAQWMRRNLGLDVPMGRGEILAMLTRAQDRLLHGDPAVAGLVSARAATAGRRWYYSGLGKALENLMGRAEPASELLRKIDAWARDGKLRDEEVNWVGLRDWLRLHDRVTKQDVLAFVEGAQIHVMDMVHVEADARPAVMADISAELAQLGYVADRDATTGPWLLYRIEDGVRGALVDEPPQEARALLDQWSAAFDRTYGPNAPRELLHQDPALWSVGAQNRREIALGLLKRPGDPDVATGFRDPHWADLDVLGHIRVSDHMTVDGHRVLVLEEIQSQWAQTFVSEENVPAAPFIGKTEAWVGLLLKRAIALASAEGYDYVTWVPGQVHVRRYPGRPGESSAKTQRRHAGLLAFYGDSAGLVTDPAGTVQTDAAGNPRVGIIPIVARWILRQIGGDGTLQQVQLRTSVGQDPAAAIGFRVTQAMRDRAALGLPLMGREQRAEHAQTLPIEPRRAAAIRPHAERLVTKIHRQLDVLGDLPYRDLYRALRYPTLGRIEEANDLAAIISKKFLHLSEGTKAAIFTYMETAGASVDDIPAGKEVRAAAKRAKELIGSIGDALVRRGWIPPESREHYRDRYLPHLYLRHLLKDDAYRAIGGGKAMGDRGYTMARDETIDPYVRDVIYGQIKDPAFLTSMAITRPMRDMAIYDFLRAISKQREWVLPTSLTTWNGETVTVQWLKAEQEWMAEVSRDESRDAAVRAQAKDTAERMQRKIEESAPYRVTWAGKKVDVHWLRNEAKHLEERAQYPSPEAAAEARMMAEQMRKVIAQAEIVLEAVDSFEDYRRMPNTPRYGRLRGLFVRKEIYSDLVGIAQIVPSDLAWYHPQSILGYGGVGTKVTQWFKISKVVLNPGSWVRNAVGGITMLHLSGIPLHLVPTRIIQAVREIARNGLAWQIGKRMGVKQATWIAQETVEIEKEMLQIALRTQQMNPVRRIGAIALGFLYPTIHAAGRGYMFIDATLKVAKIIDGMKREGKSEIEASLAAHDWLFDYSQVPEWVRYVRNAPIGTPFLTFHYLAAPRLLETLLLHPQRFLPYVALFWSMPFLAALGLGAEYDEVEKIEELMPQHLRQRGSVIPLPWRDSRGRVQVADVGAYFPWDVWTDVGHNVYRGNYGRGVEDLLSVFFLSGPILGATTAVTAETDPFTNRPIARPGDPPDVQAGAWLSYFYGLMAPPWATSSGFLGKMHAAYEGTTDRFGDQRITYGQAAVTIAGMLAYGIDPESAAALEIWRMRREIDEVRMRLRTRLADKALTEQERRDLFQKYIAEMDRRNVKLVEYTAKAANIPPSIRQLERR